MIKSRDVLLFTSLFIALLGGSVALAQLAEPVQSGGMKVNLITVATGLTAPNHGTHAPGNADRLFVTDQVGTLWAIDLTTGDKTVFLDVSGRLTPLGVAGPGTFDERGLLGVAFHPGYATNGLLYTYTSEPVDGAADFSTIPIGETANHQSLILEWHVPDPSDPASLVDPASARALLRIDQPQFNHDGGALAFGPDGMLYISLGDGGGRDDEGFGHAPGGNSQDLGNVLGAVLRIDVDGSNSVNGQYGIPVDNPFVGMSGVVEEIFAYGFRNPFRFSFDRERGDLYVGDVGQDDCEEVDVVVAGGNYGWNVKEGSFCFDPAETDPGYAYEQEPCPGEPPGLIDPVAEYNTADSLDENADGRAVIGGFVYRGSAIPALVGHYVFGDFSRFTEFGPNDDGRLFYLGKKDIVDDKGIKTSGIREFRLLGPDRLGRSVMGFGEDAEGELYVMANSTGVPFGAGESFVVPTGVVMKITRDPGERAQRFQAHLEGAQGVPLVDTATTGWLDVRLNDAVTEAEFDLDVMDGVAITDAHLHCASAGENGPAIAVLFGHVPGGFDVSRDLAEFTLTDANILRADADCIPSIGMAIWDLADLAQAMLDGKIYVNVYSMDFPAGVIRGQLEAH